MNVEPMDVTCPTLLLEELIEAAWAVRPYAIHTDSSYRPPPPSLAKLDAALRAARDLGIGEHPEYADDVWTDEDEK